MKKDTFSLRKTFLQPVSNLSDAQIGRLFKAIYQYHCGVTPEVTDDIAVHFQFFEAEFKAEEEKRRIRAEKAAERRRRKLEAAKAAAENAPATESVEHIEPVIVDNPDKCSYKNIQFTSGEEMEVIDLRKVGLPLRRSDFDILRTSFIQFRQYLSRHHLDIFQNGAHRLAIDEYATLLHFMTMEEIDEYVRKLHEMPNWHKEGRAFFHVIMRMHDIDERLSGNTLFPNLE